jgi:hypothetical protein
MHRQRTLLHGSATGSEEVGVRGLTYDETSVVYSLLWNQPSLRPSPYCYTGRRATPLVGKGAKGKAVGLPLFYTASPDHPIRERDERGKEEETEIREVVCIYASY